MKINKTIILFIIICIISTTICFAEPIYYPFSEEEIIELASKMKQFETTDSIQTKIIAKQDTLISNYERNILLDSLQINLLNEKIEIYKQHNMVKWYDNKYIWFGYGVFFTYITSLIVMNLSK